MKEISELRIQVTAKNQFPRLYDPALFSEDKSEMSIETAVAVAKAAVALGITKIRLTGGEPMVHKRFMDILREIHRRGMFVAELNTNGYFLTREVLDGMKEIGCRPLINCLQSAQYTPSV